MVYTNGNRFIVANAKNILESFGVKIAVKNEYASGAIGEVSPFDTWVELWVVRDADYDMACKILESAISDENASPWRVRAAMKRTMNRLSYVGTVVPGGIKPKLFESGTCTPKEVAIGSIIGLRRSV